MAGPCYLLDSAQVVVFGGFVVCSVLQAELLSEGSVGRSEIFSDYFFGDVATNILSVIAFLFDFGFLDFGLENLNLLLILGVLWDCKIVVKDQTTLFVGWTVDKLAEEGITGAGSPHIEKNL